MQVRRSPALGHTLRTNYGTDLSVFLVTWPSDGVPAKLDNHRDGGKRLAGDLGRMQNSSRRHGRFRGVTLGPGFVPSHPSLRKSEGLGIRLVA